MSFDSRAVLIEGGARDDADIDLFTTAMAFAAPSHEGMNFDRYFSHMKKLSRAVQSRFDELVDAGAKDDAGTRLAALKHIFHDRENYRGDEERPADLQNADMVRVIDRRLGMAVALCILYIQAGRENGWSLEGLNFPGHFLARIEHNGDRLIFDPFNGCKVMGAPDLRALLKRMSGPGAELSADFYKPCGNRDILLRLQNNVKSRLIDAEDYESALECVEMMRIVAPDEYRLLLDAGVLYAKLERREAAAGVLEKYIALAPNQADRRDAENILRSLRDTVH